MQPNLEFTPRVRRPRPAIVSLTQSAADQVKSIMQKAEQDYIGLRIGVKQGGCAGQEYVMSYAQSIDPLDEVVTDKEVTILIEAKAVLYLVGTVIDFETNLLSSKFVFRNPNETDACGCGESVTIKPADTMLD